MNNFKVNIAHSPPLFGLENEFRGGIFVDYDSMM